MNEDQDYVPSALSVEVSEFIRSGLSAERASLMSHQQTIVWLIPVPPMPPVQRAVAAEVEQAHRFFFDPHNTQLGTYEERVAKYNEVAASLLTQCFNARIAAYDRARCAHRNIDWNQGGNSSWQSIDCLDRMRFIQNTLVHTTTGDWKAGPLWYNDGRAMKWETGGHHHSETFATCEAHYYTPMNDVVTREIHTIQEELADKGCPTPPFPPVAVEGESI